jgi:hypothetical protein
MPQYKVTVGEHDYKVDAPDPDTAWSWANSYVKSPEAKQRTWGEATQDVGAGLLSGIGQLGQFPGQLYGLATGNFDKSGLYGAAQDLEQYGESLKSQGLKTRESARQTAIEEAAKKGIFSEAKTAAGETLKDPGLLFNFFAEQIPSQLPALLAALGGPEASLGVAAARTAAKKAVGEIAKKDAEDLAKKAAIKAGTRAAIGTGAVQQGADVGAQTYKDVYDELIARDVKPEQAAKGAIDLARAAGASGAVISLLAQKLPGAQAMERAFAGERTGLGRIAGAGLGALKEIPGEMIEEGGGQFTQNLAKREVNPNQSLTQGVGTAVGLAGLGGGLMGGVTGALAGKGEPGVDINLTNIPADQQQTQQTQQVTTNRNMADLLKSADEIKAQELADKAKAEGTEAPKPKRGKKEFVPSATPGSIEELDEKISYNQTEAARLQGLVDANTDKTKPFANKKHENNVVNKLTRTNAELNSYQQALAQRLAAGEKRAEQPINPPSGTSAGVPSGASTNVPPAGGSQGTTAAGVVSPGTNAPSTNVGTQQGTPPVTGQQNGAQTTQTQQTTPQEQTTTAPTVKSAAQDDLDLLNSLLGSPDELPSAGSARRTTAQIATDAKIDSIAQRYGLTRGKVESSLELGQRIKNALEFEKQRETTPVQDINNKLLAGQELKEEKGYFPEQQQRDLYEETRQEFNKGTETEDEKLPAYKELSDDERRKYFQEHISQNNQLEHDKAAKALSNYIESKRSESRAAPDYERTEAVDQVRARESYNRERGGFGAKTGLAYAFPAWNSLSDAARASYTAINKTDTVNEQYLAFKAVKDQIQKDKLEESSKENLAESETEATQKMLLAAERARKSQPTGKGQILPDVVLRSLLAGDIKTVLNYIKDNGQGLKLKKGYTLVPVLDKNEKIVHRRSKALIRDSIAQRIFRTLAERLVNVENLKVNVVFDENMTLDDIAKYNANTNTLYIGPNGLDEATVLHELTHAATVKIVHQYFTDKTKLPVHARKAVEQMQAIAIEAKKRLGSKHKNAFENLYEFIAYAMTDLSFQYELAQIQIPKLAEATNKEGVASPALQLERENIKNVYDELAETLWDAFTGSIAYLYKLFKPNATKQEAYVITEASRPITYKNKVREELLTDEEKKKAALDITDVTKEKASTFRITNLLRETITEPGYKGNLLLEAAAALQQIMEAPEGGIKQLAGKESFGAELQASKTGAQTKKAAASVERTADQIIEAQKIPTQATIGTISKFLTSTKGVVQLATKFASDRFPIKFWEDALQRADKIIHEGPRLNNIYTQIALAAARAKDLYLTYVASPSYALSNSIGEYAKASKLTNDEALKTLNAYMLAEHEGERRYVKYMLNVPLSQTEVKNIANSGMDLSPADFRKKVFDLVESGTLSKDELKTLRKELDAVVKQYVDPAGYSPNGKKSIKLEDTEYNVIGGVTTKEVQNLKDKLDKDPNKALFKKVQKSVQDLQKATTDLNKQSNYWSKPVQSVVDFYGWENYIPFKGKEIVGSGDDLLDFDSRRYGRELQDAQNSFDGRETFADNSLIQVKSDATRAAMRAGRKDYTLAIKNAIEQKLLAGHRVGTILFSERDTVDLNQYKGTKTFFHYNENGTIDIYAVDDAVKLEAIRRTYKDTNPLIDQLNNLTSTVGMFHTRYNIAFAPMNFFRDALTNAFTIAVDKGIGAAAQYIGAVAKQVANGGVIKAYRFAELYNAGRIKELEAFIARDKSGYMKDMLEYVREGGMVSYLQGLTIKGTYKDLQADINSSNLKKAKDATNMFFDNYMDMFELASRTAAYRVSKSGYKAGGATDAAAKTRAAAYVKGLANFEQVGEWGRGAGAMFMFFRPAATGAVRAIETLGPMFRNTEEAIKTDLSPEVQKDAKAVAKFRESHEKQRKAAYAMSMALGGMGVAVYMMSLGLSDDDDMGRNRAATDDVNRWTKYARFFVPGMESPIQIPWGYGLGAFASAGAQLAAISTGQISIKEGLSNIISIGTDSFLPLPVSRINMFDNFPAWAMDTATPSIMRPFFEFQMNMDGLGREIYNNRQTRVGDAYTGGDSIPELWKDAAKTLYRVAGVDWSPNTLYFFANNYADGLTRLAQNGYNLSMLATGEKEFNPRTDTILFDSFFGAKSNYDARQFTEVENKVKQLEKGLGLEDADPEEYYKFLEKNPLAETIVEDFNKGTGGTLKELRKEANDIRKNPNIRPKDRIALLNNIIQAENIEKRLMIEDLKTYGIEP